MTARPTFGTKRPADRTADDSAVLAMQALVRQSFAQEAEKARQLKAADAVKVGLAVGIIWSLVEIASRFIA